MNVQGELSIILTSAPVRIGDFDNRIAQEHFNDNIDELRIWGDVRTLEEIAVNYMIELSGNEENIIRYLKMEADNSSCDEQDCNVNEAHGSREGVNEQMIYHNSLIMFLR